MSSHDTTIRAEASGWAAKVVQSHNTPQPYTLYGGWFCPFVQRSWIVLEEKKVPYRYVEINPYNKTPELLAVNPRGLIPALAVPPGVDDNGDQKKRLPLYESTVICEYLEEEFPQYEDHPLLPRDTYERAQCRLWIDHICGKIVPGWYKLMQHTPDKAYSLKDARQNLHKAVLLFAKAMAPFDDGKEQPGPWFLGEVFSMVDVMLAPWAVRMWLIDHYKDGGCAFPEGDQDGDEDDKAWWRWGVWSGSIGHRQSVIMTSSEKNDYIGVYKRYADDTTQSEVAQATRTGGRLP